MIKFFRRIRRRLLSKGKFSSYLIYALGEIVLVVIGILIALQINNWNEAQKNLVREQFYLKSLVGDMRSNLAEIQEDVTNNDLVIHACDTLLLMANMGGYQEVSDDRIGELIIALGDYAKLQLEEGTIQEIISSGSLQIIQNDSLRGILVDWDRNLIGIREMEQFARGGQEKYFALLDTFLPYYKFQFVEVLYTPEVRETYFHHFELLNTVGNIRFIASVLNQSYMQKASEIEGTIRILEQELVRNSD